MQQRPHLSEESGFGVIEVMVSALLVVVISLGVFSAFDAAGRTAEANKSRSSAAAVAAEDQERMRAMAITAVGNYTDTTSKDVDGKTYTIESEGQYVLGPSDATDCAGPGNGEQNPHYIKLTSKVTWPNRRGIDPVQADSLRAVTSGSTPHDGSASIGIINRDGAGLADVPVTLTGSGAPLTVSTNDNGCAVFGYIAPGNYTVSFSRPGYVERANPNRPAISDPIVVASEGVATKSYQYDQAGGVAVAYKTTDYNTNTEGPTNGDGFTVSNSLLGTPSTKLFAHTSAQTAQSGLTLFPFAPTAKYSVWSGRCAENKPPDAFLADATYGQTVAVPRGALAPSPTAMDLREPRLRVRVQRRTTSSTTATNNFGTMPTTGTTVMFKSTTNGCVTTATLVDTPLPGVTNRGNTGSTGTQAGNYTTFEAILPFGSYTVCGAYTASPTQRASTELLGVLNNTAVGRTHATTITIPFNEASGYTC